MKRYFDRTPCAQAAQVIQGLVEVLLSKVDYILSVRRGEVSIDQMKVRG